MIDPGGQAPGTQPQKSAAFRTATVVATIAAVCALATEYGFQLSGHGRFAVRVVEVVVLGFFIAHSVLRLYWSTNRMAHLRSVWYEFVLIALLAVAAAAIGFSDVEDKPSYYILVVHIIIVLFLFIRAAELMMLSASRFRPAQVFVASFLTLVAVGTGLLMLPAATSKLILVEDAGGREIIRGNVLRASTDSLLVQTGAGNRLIRAAGVAQPPVQADPADWSTALFTATSSVCVTGLIVESTGGYWSRFGQTVILVLIQLGGLGIMTFGAVFALLLWQNLGLRHSAVMKDMIGPTMTIQIGRVLVFILASTAVFELLGVWSLWHLWNDTGMATGQRAFWSVFHSISAFCNAGFCLYDNSIEGYGTTWRALAVFPALIIVGGLGFMVTYNLIRIARCHLRRVWIRLRGHMPKPELDRRRLTLQSKLVLVTSGILLVAATGLVMLFETLPARSAGTGRAAPATDAVAPSYASPEGAKPGPGRAEGATPALPAAPAPGRRPPPVVMSRARPAARLAYAWFQSVTARTAGFNTSTTGELTDSTKFLTILLMFVGASPGSTGGGIKTATLAVILCGIWSMLRNRPTAQAFRRTIPQSILFRSLVVMTLGTGLVAVATILLSVTQTDIRFLDALFEATSAFGTVGLSTGVTGTLNLAGRLLIIVVMFAGRVGPLTLFIALPLGLKKSEYAFPSESVAVG